tara:strand:- start:69 stop:416 length:348 start_codon:yes stop_codon:yes gene_type:complete
MAKAAFRVEDGIIPGHTDNDLGHSSFKFRHSYFSGNAQVDGSVNVTTDVNVTRDVNITRDLNVTADLDVDGNTSLNNLVATGGTIDLPNFSGGGGGGGGGGVSQAEVIALAVALG